MKPEQMYQNLKDLAEKLNIIILEQNFKQTSVRAKSGFCRVKGKNLFVMDKSISVRKKNRILASFLSQMPHEEVYVMPAVRELLQQHRGEEWCFEQAPDTD